MKHKKNGLLLLSLVLVLLMVNLQVLWADEAVDEGKKLIDSKIDCKDLTDEQLNQIGDYYMEQMHPGEAHELMEERMGGEDSATTKAAHISMAKYFYCNDTSAMSSGMMGQGMMGKNAMMNGLNDDTDAMMRCGKGMMGSTYGWNRFGVYALWNVLFFILLAGVIIVVYLYAIKLLKEINTKRK